MKDVNYTLDRLSTARTLGAHYAVSVITPTCGQRVQPGSCAVIGSVGVDKEVLQAIHRELGEECPYERWGSHIMYVPTETGGRTVVLLDRFAFHTNGDTVYVWVQGQDWGFC